MKLNDKIWLEPINNGARYSQELIETNITKVGRKYFEVEGMMVENILLIPKLT